MIMVVHHLNLDNIYHRDLKPENFLIKTDSNGKKCLHLNDFGFAKDTKNYERIISNLHELKGTV